MNISLKKMQIFFGEIRGKLGNFEYLNFQIGREVSILRFEQKRVKITLF